MAFIQQEAEERPRNGLFIGLPVAVVSELRKRSPKVALTPDDYWYQNGR
jgi:hypothetical protein